MYLILLIVKKYKTKIIFAFILKKATSFSRLWSLVFTFDLKGDLGSSFFPVLATKLFHKSRLCIDIQNLLFHS